MKKNNYLFFSVITLCVLIFLSESFLFIIKPKLGSGSYVNVDSGYRNAVIDSLNGPGNLSSTADYYFMQWLLDSAKDESAMKRLFEEYMFTGCAVLSEQGEDALKVVEEKSVQPFRTEYDKYSYGFEMDLTLNCGTLMAMDFEAFFKNGYISDGDGGYLSLEYGATFDWDAIRAFEETYLSGKYSVRDILDVLATTGSNASIDGCRKVAQAFPAWFIEEKDYEWAVEELRSLSYQYLVSGKIDQDVQEFICGVCSFAAPYLFYFTPGFSGFIPNDNYKPVVIRPELRQLGLFQMLSERKTTMDSLPSFILDGQAVNNLVATAKKYGFFEENYKTPTLDFLDGDYNTNFVVCLEKELVKRWDAYDETGYAISISNARSALGVHLALDCDYNDIPFVSDRRPLSESLIKDHIVLFCDCVPSAISSDFSNGTYKGLVREPNTITYKYYKYNRKLDKIELLTKTENYEVVYSSRVYYIRTKFGYYIPFSGYKGDYVNYYYDKTKDMAVFVENGLGDALIFTSEKEVSERHIDYDFGNYGALRDNYAYTNSDSFYANFTTGELEAHGLCFMYVPMRQNKDYYDYTEEQIEMLRQRQRWVTTGLTDPETGAKLPFPTVGMRAKFTWNPKTYEMNFTSVEYINVDGVGENYIGDTRIPTTVYKTEKYWSTMYRCDYYITITPFFCTPYMMTTGTIIPDDSNGAYFSRDGLSRHIYDSEPASKSPYPTLAPTSAPSAVTATPVPTKAPTATPTPKPTATPVPTKAATPTPAPTKAVTPTAAPTVTPTPTDVPVTLPPAPSEAATPTEEPEVTPVEEPTEAPTPTESAEITPAVTDEPEPTETPAPTPTEVPVTPTASPVPTPTDALLPTVTEAVISPAPTVTVTPEPNQNNTTTVLMLCIGVAVALIFIIILVLLFRKSKKDKDEQ